MNGQTIALIGLGATVIANVAALAWGASRISTTVTRLDQTLQRVADSHDTEARRNATQDARLDEHGRWLDRHDEDINELRRMR